MIRMSLYASEIIKFRQSTEYPKGEGIIADIRRINAETSKAQELAEKTGAYTVENDPGYARIKVKGKMPHMKEFGDILMEAKNNDKRTSIIFLRNGFEIRKIFGRSESIKVRDISSFLNGKMTKFEYSNSCLDDECYRGLIDKIARKLRLNID
jgi:hypothetical protein